jgi:hypothetical protein
VVLGALASLTGSTPESSASPVVWHASVDVSNTIEFDDATYAVVAVDTSVAHARLRLAGPDRLLVPATKLSASGWGTCTVLGAGTVNYLKPGAIPQKGRLASGTTVNPVVEMWSPVLGVRTLATWQEGARVAVGVFPEGTLECTTRPEAPRSGAVWHLGMVVEKPPVEYDGETHAVVAVDTKAKSGARLRLDEAKGLLVGATALVATGDAQCIVTGSPDGVRYLQPGPIAKEGLARAGTVVTKVTAMDAPTMGGYVLAYWPVEGRAVEGVFAKSSLSCTD